MASEPNKKSLTFDADKKKNNQRFLFQDLTSINPGFGDSGFSEGLHTSHQLGVGSDHKMSRDFLLKI